MMPLCHPLHLLLHSHSLRFHYCTLALGAISLEITIATCSQPVYTSIIALNIIIHMLTAGIVGLDIQLLLLVCSDRTSWFVHQQPWIQWFGIPSFLSDELHAFGMRVVLPALLSLSSGFSFMMTHQLEVLCYLSGASFYSSMTGPILQPKNSDAVRASDFRSLNQDWDQLFGISCEQTSSLKDSTLFATLVVCLVHWILTMVATMFVGGSVAKDAILSIIVWIKHKYE